MKVLLGLLGTVLILAYVYRDDVKGIVRRDAASKTPGQSTNPMIPDTTDQARTMALASLHYRPHINHAPRPGPGPDTGTGVRVGAVHSHE